MNTLLTMDVQSAAIQTLETLYIISTSKNIDTIIGRYDFLLTRINTLISAKNNSDYSLIIRVAIYQFKVLRPDIGPQDYQLTLLSNPDTFTIMDFYSNSLVNAIKRYCEKQSEEIKALKKKDVKAKRISMVNETIKSTLYEVETKCPSALSLETALAEIKRLANKFGGTKAGSLDSRQNVQKQYNLSN